MDERNWNENGSSSNHMAGQTGTQGDERRESPQDTSYRMTGCGTGNESYRKFYTDSTAQSENSSYTSSSANGTAQSNSYASGGAAQSQSGSYASGGAAQSQNGQSASAGGDYSRFYTNSSANAQTNAASRKEARRQERMRKREARRSGGRRHGFAATVGKCAVCAVIFGLISGGIFLGLNQGTLSKDAQSQADATASRASEDEADVKDNLTAVDKGDVEATEVSADVTATDVSQIVSGVMPSIVSITNMAEVQYQDWFGQMYTDESESCGSGIIIGQDDESIYIATNNHVVQDATAITVGFIDDSTTSAEVKGTYSSMDLAVVSVPVADLSEDTLNAIKVATLGDSSGLEVGEGAIAIGNALGYGQSVTTGVISAVDREVTLEDETTGQSITNDLIQTDAAINPGNSGGALLNMKGEVIGINSAKFASNEIEGMGFAIPISVAEPILDSLITREMVDESESSYLGISGVDVQTAEAETYGMPEGIYVAKVYEGTAAESAGLQKGDIITSFDGYTVDSMESLSELMQYYSAGTKVELTVQRAVNGEYEEQTLSVTLGSKN